MTSETKNETLGGRINELMFRLGKNQSSFGRSIGYSQTSINNTIKGITKPGSEMIQKILEVYPTVNEKWLVQGEGEMYKNAKVDLNKGMEQFAENWKKQNAANEQQNTKNSDGGTMWEALIYEKDKRIDELTRYVNNLEYTVNLQKKMLGNFNDPIIDETEVIRMYTDAELQELHNPVKLAIG